MKHDFILTKEEEQQKEMEENHKGGIKNMTYDYTIGNKDDTTEAVHGLDIFTKNWCMNCEETKKKGEPVFRCDECSFKLHHQLTDYCLVKKFVNDHDHNYPIERFCAMRQ